MYVLALALWLATAAPAKTHTNDTAKRIVSASKLLDANDCPGALVELKPVLGQDAETLEPSQALAVLTIGAICEIRASHITESYGYALRATRYPDASAPVWRIRFLVELERKDSAAAVHTLELIADGSAAILSDFDTRWLWGLNSALVSNKQGELRLRFLKVVSETYDPEPLVGNADAFRRMYAVLLNESDQRVAARAVLKGISLPSVLRLILLDARLRDALPAGFDIRKATEQRLEIERGLMKSNPDKLAPVLELASSLRQLGRAQDALSVLQGARLGVSEEKFADIADQKPWWWDSMSRTYMMLGRQDDAIESLRTGMGVKENGGENISQVINLAQVLNNRRRPADALATFAAVNKLGTASPFGEMQIRFAKGCAYAQLGRNAAAAVERAYVEAHRLDAVGTPFELYICMKDYDAAAADVIARLKDAENRPAILAEFAKYDDPPGKLAPTIYEEGLAVLAKRSDVQQAIANAGGIVRMRVQREEG